MQGQKDCHEIPGKSAEKGCFQYQDPTWQLYAKITLGYIPPRTYINEKYVAAKMVERWLKQGMSAYQIGLAWNGGTAVEKKGINKYGQEYDTAAYARSLLAYLNR